MSLVQLQPKQSYTLLKGLGQATCLIVQIPCALVIGQYDPSHSRGRGARIERWAMLCTRSWNLLTHVIPFRSAKVTSEPPSLPNFIIDPSATIFLNAIMIYTSALLMHYVLGTDNRYQDRFLWLGGLLGILVGVFYLWSGSGLHALKDAIPMSITTTLALGQLCCSIGSWFVVT